jgi:hypothetical protein
VNVAAPSGLSASMETSKPRVSTIMISTNFLCCGLIIILYTPAWKFSTGTVNKNLPSVTLVSVTGISCPLNLERTRLFIGVPVFKFQLIWKKFWA